MKIRVVLGLILVPVFIAIFALSGAYQADAPEPLGIYLKLGYVATFFLALFLMWPDRDRNRPG